MSSRYADIYKGWTSLRVNGHEDMLHESLENSRRISQNLCPCNRHKNLKTHPFPDQNYWAGPGARGGADNSLFMYLRQLL